MVTMTKGEAITAAIDALRSEAVSSSESDRVEKAVAELNAGGISEETLAFMDENITTWWRLFGSSLGGDEESLGEMLITQFEEARDNLKKFV